MNKLINTYKSSNKRKKNSNFKNKYEPQKINISPKKTKYPDCDDPSTQENLQSESASILNDSKGDNDTDTLELTNIYNTDDHIHHISTKTNTNKQCKRPMTPNPKMKDKSTKLSTINFDRSNIYSSSIQSDFKAEIYDENLNKSKQLSQTFKSLKSQDLDKYIPFITNKNLKPVDRSKSTTNIIYQTKLNSKINFKQIKKNFPGIEDTKKIEEIETILSEIKSSLSKSTIDKTKFMQETRFPKSDGNQTAISQLEEQLHPSGITSAKVAPKFNENIQMVNNIYRKTRFEVKNEQNSEFHVGNVSSTEKLKFDIKKKIWEQLNQKKVEDYLKDKLQETINRKERRKSIKLLSREAIWHNSQTKLNKEIHDIKLKQDQEGNLTKIMNMTQAEFKDWYKVEEKKQDEGYYKMIHDVYTNISPVKKTSKKTNENQFKQLNKIKNNIEKHQNQKDSRNMAKESNPDHLQMQENSKIKMQFQSCFKNDHGMNRNGLTKQFSFNNIHQQISPNEKDFLRDNYIQQN